MDGADIGAVQAAVYHSLVGAAGMLLSCTHLKSPPCTFDLAERACYVRASGKLCGSRFADLIIISCCCVLRAYTATTVHGDACCCDGLRRAARLLAQRAASLARVVRGSMWRHRLWVPGFESTVAVWLGIHRVDGC